MERSFIVSLLATLVLTIASAQAQQPMGTRRIGFLAAIGPAAVSDRLAAFRQGMPELGHVEEQTISIESRYAEGQLTRLADLAAELVRLKVDVILSADRL